jgi:hypothetical protein
MVGEDELAVGFALQEAHRETLVEDWCARASCSYHSFLTSVQTTAYIEEKKSQGTVTGDDEKAVFHL